MTTFALAPARFPRLTTLFDGERLFFAAGLFLAFSLLITVPALALDPRQFQGESNWVKPIKFQVALSVYLLSLAFFARYLPPGMVSRSWYRIYAAVVIICVMGELAWIGGAAAYGTASHFNVSTPAMAALYGLMGVFAVTLTSATLVYGIAIARNPNTGLDPALKLSVVLGLVLTFALTLPAAGTMSSMPGHLVGTPVLDATVPIIGWSREVGDLRIAHFFATHALHFIPLAGLLIAYIAPGNKALVWTAAGVFSVLIASTFVQALSGMPLLAL